MIGLCIKYFHENYGGMLQAFATTKIIEKKGIEYELIRYEKQLTLAEKIRFIPRVFNRVLINDKVEAFIKKRGKKKHPQFSCNDRVRMEAFAKFREKNFAGKERIYKGYKNLCEGAGNYEAVITGSDQLWSPAGLPTNFYNLMFVGDGIKKISYASSFGVSSIPWYQRGRTRKFLERIDYISMRENRGSEIVRELTGRKPLTVLDPVFMLSCDEWKEYIPDERVYEDKYVFAYFLGNNEEHRSFVKKYAKEHGIKIVTLRHLDQYVDSDEQFGDYAPYDVAPDKFLNLLRNAETVFTDSFHGMCFSVINHKQFMVFNRYDANAKHSKNSRIDTMCDNLGLSKNRFKGQDSEVNIIDYTQVDKVVEKLRSEADEYLNECLFN
ncbi:MAG: polysaccharide pyruvyl transferase family protein [Lachnospiraceae bacterium]|nr:polysaccharide pyruvyl transferase family protein [Lachnospiraceae bacterium]